MRVLGIETATGQGGVAVVGPEGLLAEVTLSVTAGYGERLLPALERILAAAGLSPDQLDGYAISIGPGSFTGLRIGLATVKGLALATGKPLAAVPTLEALAASLPFCAHPVCPLLDARKGEVYCALFALEGAEPVRLLEDTVCPLEVLLPRITRPTVFIGDALASYGEALRRRLGEKALFPPPGRGGASPAVVAARGRARLLRGEAEDVDRLVPRYLRLAEAELALKARRAGRP